MNNKTGPNASLIYDLYSEGMKPQIIRMALLMDVFTPLAEGSKDVRGVASRCEVDEVGVEYLLDYLCSLDLLEKTGGDYGLTETAATFLVPGSPNYAGDWLLFQTSNETWAGILNAMRGGQRDFPPTPWAQDAWLESYSGWRIPASLEMWAAAGIQPGKCEGLQILDLACGCAIKSFALADADETVRVRCVDSSDVLEVARDLAGRMGVLARVDFQPGDIHAIDLGSELYGAVLLGQISYFLRPEENLALFKRIHRTLLPGGVLVVDAAMAPDIPDELYSLTSLMMWAWSGGAAHPFEVNEKLLKEAGFRTIEQHSDWWLTATKETAS